MYNKNMEEVLPNMYLVLAFLVFSFLFSARTETSKTNKKKRYVSKMQ